MESCSKSNTKLPTTDKVVSLDRYKTEKRAVEWEQLQLEFDLLHVEALKEELRNKYYIDKGDNNNNA